jgi:hypothetical protein
MDGGRRMHDPEFQHHVLIGLIVATQRKGGSMDAQTIAQVKAEAPADLWHFLLNLPVTQEAQLFYALMLSGSMGMIASYVMKWAKSEIDACLGEYLFQQNQRATVLAFLTYTRHLHGSDLRRGFLRGRPERVRRMGHGDVAGRPERLRHRRHRQQRPEGGMDP